jgi:hypothetical protein
MDVNYKKNIKDAGEVMLNGLNISRDLALRTYAALQKANADRKTLESWAVRIQKYDERIYRIEREMLNNNF